VKKNIHRSIGASVVGVLLLFAVLLPIHTQFDESKTEHDEQNRSITGDLDHLLSSKIKRDGSSLGVLSLQRYIVMEMVFLHLCYIPYMALPVHML